MKRKVCGFNENDINTYSHVQTGPKRSAFVLVEQCCSTGKVKDRYKRAKAVIQCILTATQSFGSRDHYKKS